jgi:3-phosphoshikimate 1-carboxyvinyltransferase
VISRWTPARRLGGELRPPADKSISHRAALVAAMTPEPVRVVNYLDAADTNATLGALEGIGTVIDRRPDELVVRGVGLRHPVEPTLAIDVGNSGTLMRLLPGWLAALPGTAWRFDGDGSIRRRPVDRIAAPLALMGARIEAREGRYPPFTVHGARLHAIEYELPVASAQVKSCLLLAGLTLSEPLVVREPVPTRDHTERLLRRAGVEVERRDGAILVHGTDELELEEVQVPGDLSSAAFALCAALLVPGSRLRLRDVGVNWTRTGLLRIIERMGARVQGALESPGASPAEEPVSDLEVRAGPLQATEVEPDEVPLAIDELPLVALLGCFAEGTTIVRGAEELRVKETDRIAAVVDGLRGLGARIEGTPDGFVVHGTGGLEGGRLDARGDHRMAMLGAVAGLASRHGVEVDGFEAATVSYPTFGDDVARLVGN